MPITLEKLSPCKVNLLLNILGRRPDGFHKLETLMQPVTFCDRLVFKRSAAVTLTCNEPSLAVDANNLVHRAATAFLSAAELSEGVSIHLEKQIPMAAGLGGGSSNAATTLLGCNELFDYPMSATQLHQIAAHLGSDVPFFLQSKPALATGRGEQIQALEAFPALAGKCLLLIHPGFGIATAWAYQNLSRFPAAQNGEPGRARRLAEKLAQGNLTAAVSHFYNSLEAPALEKYPILALYQEFLREHGAVAAMMSGSGSASFAIVPSRPVAESIAERFKAKFSDHCWLEIVPV